MAGAGDDLGVAFQLERAVGGGRHGERTVPRFQYLWLLQRRLAGGGEARLGVAAVAERLVLGCAAPAERGAEEGFAVEHDLCMDRERPVLAHPRRVDDGRLLLRPAILADIGDGARRTAFGDGDDALDAGGVGMDPFAGGVGHEDVGVAKDAVARVDAALA